VKKEKGLERGKVSKMANYWYHEFSVRFSWEVAVIAIAVLAAAYLIGRKSVHVLPRKGSVNTALSEDAPRRIKGKVAQAKKMIARSYRKAARKGDSVIMFRSATFDRVVAAIAAIVFVVVFAKEHWTGLVQFFINGLSASDSAVWGYILAMDCVIALGAAYAYLSYIVVRAGQVHTAVVLGEKYLARGVSPLFGERKTIAFIARLFAWAVGSEIAEKKAAAKEKAAAKARLSLPDFRS
jgi:hypothetical protein